MLFGVNSIIYTNTIEALQFCTMNVYCIQRGTTPDSQSQANCAYV